MAKLKQDIWTKGRITDYGLGKNGSGDPQVVISFLVNLKPEAKDESEAEWYGMTWYGNLGSEKGREITGKALLICGFKEGSVLADLGAGKDADVLDMNRPINMQVGPDTYYSKKEKTDVTKDKIKWINAPGEGGGGGQVEKMDNSEAKKLLSSINTKKMMSQIRSENAHLAKLAEEDDEENTLF